MPMVWARTIIGTWFDRRWPAFGIQAKNPKAYVDNKVVQALRYGDEHGVTLTGKDAHWHVSLSFLLNYCTLVHCNLSTFSERVKPVNICHSCTSHVSARCIVVYAS